MYFVFYAGTVCDSRHIFCDAESSGICRVKEEYEKPSEEQQKDRQKKLQ